MMQRVSIVPGRALEDCHLDINDLRLMMFFGMKNDRFGWVPFNMIEEYFLENGWEYDFLLDRVEILVSLNYLQTNEMSSPEYEGTYLKLILDYDWFDHFSDESQSAKGKEPRSDNVIQLKNKKPKDSS